MDNRIREWRKRRGLTQEALARRVGTSVSEIHKLEVGKRRLTTDWLRRLGGALHCPAVELMAGEEGDFTVPVVGYVGAGEQVYAIDDHALGHGIDSVTCPLELDPETTVAVAVRGDSMLPIQDGWLLFYHRDYDGVPEECIGHLCVVRVADDGPVYVKQLRRGYSSGCFNLISTNASPIEDARLEWAAPVLLILPNR
jgi:transcriptional regulator with XRE-family HTH domain